MTFPFYEDVKIFTVRPSSPPNFLLIWPHSGATFVDWAQDSFVGWGWAALAGTGAGAALAGSGAEAAFVGWTGVAFVGWC